MSLLALTRNPRLPLTIRKKIGKMASPPVGTTFRINMFGQSYEGQTGNHMDNKIYLYGMHEAATIRLMRTILAWQRANGQRPVLMDIGTNAGQHLLATATLSDHAFGFEPWEPVRNKALRNVALNKLQHAQIFPFGLSDENAQLSYAPPATDNFGAGSFAGSGTLTLEVRRGDEVVGEHGIVPTLLKIDVEGFERRVLKGLQSTLHRHRPAVIFEYSDMSRKDFDTPEKCAGIFGPGYSFYGIRRSREFPVLDLFDPRYNYENILTWPETEKPRF